MRSLPVLLLLACGGPPSAPGPDPADPPQPTEEVPQELPEPAEPLPARKLLIRASLDLRGVRPTPDELAAVEADPTAVHDLITAYSEDPRFGARVGYLFLETYRTIKEDTFVDLDYYFPLLGRDALLASVGWEPLQVLAWIADHDLPYTDLVTADWTVANEVLGAMWPLDYPAGATGWKRVHYTDGRPAAGVLASNGLWWQYGSMLNNLNRGRANAYSRIFLCQDYLDTEVEFSPDALLDSEAALGAAIRTNPACAGCHDSLDPLASHFFGFWYFSLRKALPDDVPYYHPERERLWQDLGGLPPAFSGQPTTGLADLGRRTADDPRFAACFTRRAWEGMLRRTATPADQPELSALQARFDASDLNVRALFQGIVSSPSYREGAGDTGLKVTSPATLASHVEATTGFAWRSRGRDLMVAPVDGFMALAGGVEGLYRSVPMKEPGTTLVLVQKRLAEAAAGYAVADTSAGDGRPDLFTRIDWTERPETDHAIMAEQIADLHLAVLSERLPPDDPLVLEELDLWSEVYAATSDPRIAWQAVLSALLRDPSLLVY